MSLLQSAIFSIWELEGAKEEIRNHIGKRHVGEVRQEIGVLGRLGKKNILE
jgi:hypothetical protein